MIMWKQSLEPKKIDADHATKLSRFGLFMEHFHPWPIVFFFCGFIILFGVFVRSCGVL